MNVLLFGFLVVLVVLGHDLEFTPFWGKRGCSEGCLWEGGTFKSSVWDVCSLFFIEIPLQANWLCFAEYLSDEFCHNVVKRKRGGVP